MKNQKKNGKKTARVKSGLALFIREIASNPIAMGAAWPSSKYLANTIAFAAPLSSSTVVELGAGTGVVTEALLEHGIAPSKLSIVERSPALAQHLKKRFPQLNVLQGDARELSKLLTNIEQPIATVVSSLPLRSLPKAVVKDIGEELDKVLTKDSLFIQFTYSLHRKPKAPSGRFHWIYSKYIWRNLPPARVDVFSYDG